MWKNKSLSVQAGKTTKESAACKNSKLQCETRKVGAKG